MRLSLCFFVCMFVIQFRKPERVWKPYKNIKTLRIQNSTMQSFQVWKAMSPCCEPNLNNVSADTEPPQYTQPTFANLFFFIKLFYTHKYGIILQSSQPWGKRSNINLMFISDFMKCSENEIRNTSCFSVSTLLLYQEPQPSWKS